MTEIMRKECNQNITKDRNYVDMQIPTKPIAVSGQEQMEEESGLGKSEVLLDASTKASLAAMFGDDD